MAAGINCNPMVARRLVTLAGRRCAQKALDELLHAVAQAHRAPARLVAAGDLFSCFVLIPVDSGGRARLRVYWRRDPVSEAITVIKLHQG